MRERADNMKEEALIAVGERELVSFFVYQKLKEILIRYSRIIFTASKDRLISKV